MHVEMLFYSRIVVLKKDYIFVKAGLLFFENVSIYKILSEKGYNELSYVMV